MKTIIMRYGILFCLSLLLGFSVHAQDVSVFEPYSDDARQIAGLWLVMLVIATLVYIQVVSFLLIALFRKRRTNAEAAATPDISPPSRNTRLFIIINGIAIPIVILVVVFGYNLLTLLALAPSDANPALRVEVIGHRWWWEVRYPDYNIVTANEIYIPTGAEVELRLSSVDVIHSLWLPELNGKADLIPGSTNRMLIETDVVGEYLGQCAEFCGEQHAWMRLYVMAVAPPDFEQWLERQQQPAFVPADELTQRGQQIFLGAACTYCHTIRGTSASGIIGPDLTHVASRFTLGAGVVPNTRGHLAGWIIDPQAVKPGNLMPPMYLEAEDLQALVAYLESLE
jgi:cytochrome c oxidase subunit 2